MSQPNRITYKGVIPVVDGVKIPRVQSIDISGELPLENTLELGNSGIVEKISLTPNITVEVTTNDMSVDTMATFAGRYPSQPYAGYGQVLGNIGTAESHKGNGINYLGTTGVQITEGDLGANVIVKPWDQNDSIIGRGAGTTAIQIGDFTVSDFDVGTSGQAIASEILYQIQDPGTDNILMTGHIAKAFCSNISMSFPADGIATESYSFTAAKRYRYVGTSFKQTASTYCQMKAVESAILFTDVSGCKAGGPTDIRRMPMKLIHNSDVYYNIQDSNADMCYGYYVASDHPAIQHIQTKGIYMSWAGHDLTVSGSGYKSAPTLAVGDYAKLIYYDDDIAWSSISTGYDNYPGGIEGGAVDAFLYKKGAGISTGTKSLRVQSLDITVPLDREDLTQLGDPTKYFEALTYPINVTFDIEVLASDARNWFKMGGVWGRWSEAPTSGTDISLQDMTDDMALEVLVYSDKDNKIGKNLLRRIEITDAKLESEGRSASVGGNDTETYTFSSDMIKIHPHSTTADTTGSMAW